MVLLAPRTGDVLLDTLVGTQAIWGITFYARLPGHLSWSWPGVRQRDAAHWFETRLIPPGRLLCSDVWWYVWEHGAVSPTFGPWCPTRRLGPRSPHGTGASRPKTSMPRVGIA
jgi:hypothetical protein